jgi:hypothetical protein
MEDHFIFEKISQGKGVGQYIHYCIEICTSSISKLKKGVFILKNNSFHVVLSV